MPGAQVLSIKPTTELHFKGPYTEVITSTLSLTNPTEDVVYFKVKTTAPRYYCVRPNSGVVASGETAVVGVMLQPVEQPETLEKERTRHKFMIQSAVATNGDMSVDEFWKGVDTSSVMDSKLKVVFDNLISESGHGDAKTAAAGNASDHVNDSQQSTTGVDAPQRRAAATDEPRKSVTTQAKSSSQQQEQIDRHNKTLSDDNFSLVQQVQELRHKLNAATRHPTQSTGITLVQLVLVAMAAVLIGVIVGKLL